MILHRLHFVLLGTGALAAGCSASDVVENGGACTREARAGINVDVRDSVTNASVGLGALVIAREGAFADTGLATTGTTIVPLVFERAGIYTVSVTQAGYQPWTKAGVAVTNGTCHVNAVAVTARLQK